MVDEQLVAKYIQGDAEAFNTLASRYQERVYRLAFRMLGNHDDALDAVQEVFLRLLHSLPTFAHHAKFGTWLYRLAVNACIDLRRHRRSGVATVPLDLEVTSMPVEADPDTLCEKEFREHLINQALKQIPASQRLLVVLRDQEGLSYGQIAEILDVEVGTLKSRLHRARGALRRVLETGVTVEEHHQVGRVRLTPTGDLAVS